MRRHSLRRNAAIIVLLSKSKSERLIGWLSLLRLLQTQLRGQLTAAVDFFGERLAVVKRHF